MLSYVDIEKLPMSPRNLANRRFPPEVLNTVLYAEKCELTEYRHLMKNPKYRQLYGQSYGKELGRLSKGIPGQVKVTNKIFFIDKANLPVNCWKDVNYGRIVVSYLPEKDDPYRTRLTVGGDWVNYPVNFDTTTVDLLTVKLLLNSIISTLGAKNITIDIKYFYLNNPMTRFEYMRLKLTNLSNDFVQQ